MCEIGRGTHCFACRYPAPFVERTILFSVELAWHSRWKSMIINLQVYFWNFNFVPLIFMLIHVPVSHCPDKCNFAISFQIKDVITQTSLSLFKIVLNPLQFQMNFRISLSIPSFYLAINFFFCILFYYFFTLFTLFLFLESLLSSFWILSSVGLDGFIFRVYLHFSFFVLSIPLLFLCNKRLSSFSVPGFSFTPQLFILCY